MPIPDFCLLLLRAALLLWHLLSYLQQGEESSVPEDVGRQAAKLLFEEIHRGGCVDSAHQVPLQDYPFHCRHWRLQALLF